jgi:ABC-type multidrug transport system fused ATPase/permease subunit
MKIKINVTKMHGADSNETICSQNTHKNYIIKRPNLTSQFFMGSFLMFLLVVVLFLIVHFLAPIDNTYNRNVFTIMEGIFLIVGILSAFMGFCGIVWKVQVNGDEIIHRTIFGRKKKYTFSDVTRAVSNHDDKLRVYSDKKRLFTLQTGDKYYFEKQLIEQGIPIEDTKKMTIDAHVIKPYGILKWGSIIGLFFFSLLLKNAIKEGIFVFTICSLLSIFMLCGVLTYFWEKTEVQEDTITHHAFLKKVQVIKINQIDCLREEKSKGGIPYVVVYSGKKKIIKIRKFSDGMVLFKVKMEKERKKWYEKDE